MFEKPIKIDQETSDGIFNHGILFKTFWEISATLSIQNTPFARKPWFQNFYILFTNTVYTYYWGWRSNFSVHKFKSALIWMAVLINKCLITHYSVLEILWSDMNTQLMYLFIMNIPILNLQSEDKRSVFH